MSALKNLYDYQTTDAENILEIRSDTVEPLTSGTRKYIFRLEPTGFLDENSLLLFKLRNDTVNPLRVNQFNGVLGAIDRVQFQVGDFMLNDVDGVDKWATLNHMAKSSRTINNKVRSHYLGNQFHTKASANQRLNGTEQGVGKGEIVNNPEKSGLCFGGNDNGSSGDGAVDDNPARINSLKITDNLDNNHEYAVPLGMVIPALQGRTIPLFVFDEYRIYITVYFNTADKFVNNLALDNYSAGQELRANANDVSFHNVKLQVDYLIYPAGVIEKMKNQIEGKEGYVMDFYDIVKIEKNLPAGTSGVKQDVEFRLGQNEREVHKIFMTRKLNSGKAGRVSAMLLESRCDGMNNESINWEVNGRDEYTEDVSNPAIHYDFLTQTLDADLDVERPMFMSDENTLSSALAGFQNPLQATYKPMGLDLRNGNGGILGGGRVIGQYPIVCKYSRTPMAAIANRANATTGAMSVDFYVMATRRAVIKSGIKGNNVVVSY
jgi:hypothetical protein